MTIGTSMNDVTESVPVKRSLFNKPSWSKPQVVENSIDFFHRSHRTYVEIAAEEEHRRKRKVARKQREKALRADNDGREEKRRRVPSISEDDDDDNTSGEDHNILEKDKNGFAFNKAAVKSAARSPSPAKPSASPKSLSKRYEETITASRVEQEQKPKDLNIIDLEDGHNPASASEGGDDLVITVVKPAKPTEEDGFPASDEEFPELARKAREKARKKCLYSDTVATTPKPPQPAEENRSVQQTQPAHQSIPPPPPPDPVVHILITSRLENTAPLIIQRRLSQRLKDVRITWCQRQGFSPEAIASVFLTWRGKRLFDVTSCKSLGIAVDSDGNILTKGQKDILGEEDRQIHMEAMTDEIMKEYSNEKRRGASAEGSEAASQEVTEVGRKPEVQVKIILKAKGLNDFKLIVKPVCHDCVRRMYEHSAYITAVYSDIKDRQCFSYG